MTRPPAAVLWDCDGTLFDTESRWGPIEKALARRLGGELPPDHQRYTVGGTMALTSAYIARLTGTSVPPERIARMLWDEMIEGLSAGALPWRPGAQELVAGLAAAGIAQAVVSNSTRRYLTSLVSRVEGAPFALVVSGDDVERAKPDPEPYATACAALGVEPADALVVEDSASGARSGLSAGCRVLVIPWGQPVDLPGAVCRDTLLGLDAAGLAALWEED